MVSRQRTFSLLLAAMVSILAGCQGGSTVNVHNQPPPPGSSLAIKVQTTPDTGAILINGTATLTATVTGDSSNSGVDWIVTCQPTGNCGTLSSSHTSSNNGSVTYTPPATLPGNSQTVNVVAFATADHTQNVASPITITAFGSSLQGAYVFQAKGMDANLLPYQLAGVIALQGNGQITSGTQTLNSIAGTITTTISSGSYFIGGDGRGTITLNTVDQSSQPLIEHFSIVVLSASQALIAEDDPPQSSSGTLDLQTATTFPTGGYAFAMSGIDAGGIPAAFGGIVNIDNNPSQGSISGKGSVADQDYQNALASCSVPTAFAGSSVSQPDPVNQPWLVVFNLSAVNPTTGALCLGSSGSITVNGYMIDATHIALIETDGGFMTAGTAIAQGPATGTFSLASFSGTYVFDVPGIDMATSALPSSFTSVGLLTADGSGTLTNGFMDTFLLSNCNQPACQNGGPVGAQISAQFDGIYGIDSKGIGRVHAVLKNYNPAPRPGLRPDFIFYLTGNGNPPFVLDAGGEDINYPSQGTGIAYPRTASNLTLNGKYGVRFTQQNNSENDGTGQFTANAAANPAISGAVDDIIGAGVPVTLSDAFGASDSNDRIAGTFLGTKVEYYPIDSGHGFFVETDLLDTLAPSGQVAVGYYAPRTPLCSGCP